MRAVRRALLAVVAAVAVALAAAVNVTGSPVGTVGAMPSAIQTTSYPWVQPPAGVGVTALQPMVVQATCSSVQPPCLIGMR